MYRGSYTWVLCPHMRLSCVDLKNYKTLIDKYKVLLTSIHAHLFCSGVTAQRENYTLLDNYTVCRMNAKQ